MENMLANGISVSLKNTLRNDEIGILSLFYREEG